MVFSEIKSNMVENLEKIDTPKFQNIKPESNITPDQARTELTKVFDKMTDKNEVKNEEVSLEKNLSDYFNDLKSKSDLPDTIADKPFDVSDLNKITPEQNSAMREEFSDMKKDLIQQWEERYGCQWPTYTEDVYIINKNGEQIKIREAGAKYDAHHIHPLGLGGKNTVDNITPLKADVHYDHRGVHEIGSPYDKIDKMLEELAVKNKEFLEKLSKCELDGKKIDMVEKAYDTSFPVQVRAIISSCNTPVFLEEYRVLSFSEIINAEDDLKVNLKKEKIIPLIDCGDNDFIVYDFSKKRWAKYNIIENCLFKGNCNLSDLLK